MSPRILSAMDIPNALATGADAEVAADIGWSAHAP